jgi:hypothetical protein
MTGESRENFLSLDAVVVIVNEGGGIVSLAFIARIWYVSLIATVPIQVSPACLWPE